LVYGYLLLGVVGPKNIYNSFPLKHEVINFSFKMSGEMIYNEDPEFFRAKRRLVIREEMKEFKFHVMMEI